MPPVYSSTFVRNFLGSCLSTLSDCLMKTPTLKKTPEHTVEGPIVTLRDGYIS